jgi:hypothetical protein
MAKVLTREHFTTATGEIKTVDKIQAGDDVKCLLGFGGERLPMWVKGRRTSRRSYLYHKSPFWVGKGDGSNFPIFNNLHQ